MSQTEQVFFGDWTIHDITLKVTATNGGTTVILDGNGLTVVYEDAGTLPRPGWVPLSVVMIMVALYEGVPR